MADTEKTSYLAIAEVTDSDAGNFGCFGYTYDNYITDTNLVLILPGKFIRSLLNASNFNYVQRVQ